MARRSSHVRTFASLAIRNYRLFFFAALMSNIGTWMGRTAQSWLVLTSLTDHSSTALGFVTALQFGPVLFLAPYGGVIADRFPKRAILVVTQISLGLNEIALWVLVATGTVQLWHVYLLATLMAVSTAFDNPARQAFASELVEAGLLSNAVGLNSASFNFARLIGPGLAGILIAAWGVGPAILIDGLSFAFVIAGLLAMRAEELHPAPPRRGRGAFVEGLRYVRGRPDLLLVIVVIFVFGALGMNFQVTNLLMATLVFHQGAAFGALGSIMAIGSLAGALIAARRERPRLIYLLGSLGGFAVLATALALAPDFWVYCVLLAPVGLVSITALNNANARVQLATDPQFRGRVMALYMAVFMGSTLIGSPFIGWVGDAWGPRWTILVGSIATGLALAGALIYLVASGQASRPSAHNVFARFTRRGITEDTSPTENNAQAK